MKSLHVSSKPILLLLLISLDFAFSATTTSEKPTTALRRLPSKLQRDVKVTSRAALKNFVGRFLDSSLFCNQSGSIIDLSFVTDAITSVDNFLAQLQNSTVSGSGLGGIASVSALGAIKLFKFVIPKLFIVGGIIIAAVALATIVLPSKYKPDTGSITEWMDNMFGYVQDAIDNVSNKYGGKYNSHQNDYTSGGSDGGWTSMDSGDWNKRIQSGAPQGYKQPYQTQQEPSASYQNYHYMPQKPQTVQYRRQGQGGGGGAETQASESPSFFPPEVTNEVRSNRGK